jgi:hypothetical protein
MLAQQVEVDQAVGIAFENSLAGIVGQVVNLRPIVNRPGAGHP